MKIYKTKISYFYTEDLALLKKGKEIEVSETDEEYFSTLEKAETYLKKELLEFNTEDPDRILKPTKAKALRGKIEEISLDKTSTDEFEFVLHLYDEKGNYLGLFDYDKETPNPKYKDQDWVLFLRSGYLLTCGQIAATAEGSEPYLIIYEDTNVKDCSPHDHTNELMIIEKITEAEAKNFLPSKYFELIKLRVTHKR